MKKNAVCVLAQILALFMLFSLCAAAEGESGGDAGEGAYKMSYGYDPLQAPDGAQAADYVKGPTPPTEYVAAGGSYVVAENSYTFRDYVFAGWKCGGKLYQPGETVYNVSADMTFIASWTRPTRPDMDVLGIVSYSEGGRVTETLSVKVGSTVTLRDGVWTDASGRVFEGGARFLLSATTAEFTAGSVPEDAVSVGYSGAEGAQCGFKIARGGSFTVDGCFERREGYIFTGWQSGERVYLAGNSCVAEDDVAFTAIWREETKPAPDYCTVTVVAGEGGSAVPSGRSTVLRGESFTFTVKPDEFHAIGSVLCGGDELGVGGSYTVTVREDLNITVSFKETQRPESSEAGISGAPESSVGESTAPSAAESAEPSEGPLPEDRDDGGGNRRMIAVIAAAAVCLIFVPAFVWYSSKRSAADRKKKRR